MYWITKETNTRGWDLKGDRRNGHKTYYLINSPHHPGHVSWSPSSKNALKFMTTQDAIVCIDTAKFIGDQDGAHAEVTVVEPPKGRKPMTAWNEEAWQANLSLTAAAESHGSTGASSWMHYELRKLSEIDKQVTVFLNAETCESKIMVLTEEESQWLMYGPTLEAPTKRLRFYHGR